MTQVPYAPVNSGPHEEPPTSPHNLPHAGSARGTQRRSRLAAYVALTKPRIIELLLVTTLPAMVLAAGGLPIWWVAVVTMVGGTLAAGSANALNCYVDRDIDAIMRRTTRRPLARHEVSPTGALIFGLVLGVISVLVIGLSTNWLAGALTLLAIAFYIVIYTMLLKRRTSQNIVWGGAAGCMPVLIGWTAVTGSLALAPFVLFAVVFFWTPPHTWALATRYREDYARAGVPMLPVVATPRRVARDITLYSWLTVAASLALWPLATGWAYGVLAAGAGVVLLAGAHRLYRDTVRSEVTHLDARPVDGARAPISASPVGTSPVGTSPVGTSPVGTRSARVAKPMVFFHLSNSYLAFVFVAVAVDTFLR